VTTSRENAPDAGFGPRAQRTCDPRQAEQLVARLLVDHRIELMGGERLLDAHLEGTRFGDLTATRLGYGRPVKVVCQEPLVEMHVRFVLAGSATLADGIGGRTEARAGQGAVYMPGSRPCNVLSADCVVLAMRVPQHRVEVEVASLLGGRSPVPVHFDFALRPAGGAGQRLVQVLDLLQAEVAEPVLGRMDSLDRHLETLTLQALLAAQPHNHSAAIHAQGPAMGSVVRRAAELVRAEPGRAWSTGGLAAEVHLSVRALQEGFSRELGVAPMPYVRQVRLQRVRDALAHPTEATTVGAVAARFGFAHLGRFAGHYLERFGELPSVTLSRAREERAG